MNLRNVINMYYVCEAFYRGAPFYEQDANHPINKKTNQPLFGATSIKELQPIAYENEDLGGKTEYYNASYVIDPDCHEPAAIMKELLFSRTIFECNGAVQIVNYLTIMDVLKIVHGNDKGEALFNEIYSAKSDDLHNLNCLRIGRMGNVYPGGSGDFSPIYPLMKIEKVPSIEEIKKDVSRYMGTRIYLEGNPKYLAKHPDGASMGWNLIVAGVNNENELLLLGASFSEQPYLFSYSELIEKLVKEYNLFPRVKRDEAALFCTKEDVGKFYEYSISFNIDAIKEMLFDKKEFMADTKAYCDYFYTEVMQKGNITPTSRRTHNLSDFFRPINKTTKDDADPEFMRTSKNKSRYVEHQSKACDDIQLRPRIK